MKKKISEIAESPYSECVIKDNIKIASTTSTDTEIVDLFKQSQYKYNYANCFDVCYQSLLKEKCGCIDRDVPFLNLKKIDIQTIKLCNYNNDEVNECYSKLAASLDETCGKKCPFECDIASTTTTLTYESSVGASDEVLTVSIYYPELSYEYSTESPAITPVALLSGIGGTLGKLIVKEYII